MCMVLPLPTVQLIVQRFTKLRLEWAAILKKNFEGIVVTLLTAIILGGGSLLWSVGGRISSLEGIYVSQKERLDRIARALPLLETKIAFEVYFGSVPSGVFVTKPYRIASSATLKRTVHVLYGGTVKTAVITVESETDLTAIYSLMGYIGAYSAKTFTVKDLNGMAVKTGAFRSISKSFAPGYIDTQLSVVIFKKN